MPRTSRIRAALHALRTRTTDDRGSIPLALMLISFIMIFSVAITSTIAWQISGNRNENGKRYAALAVTSTLNRAAETLGTSTRFDLGAPSSAPSEWTTSEDGTYTYRWWTQTLDTPGASAITVPTNFVFTASNGNTLVAISDDNYVYTSTDGTAWQKNGSTPLRDVADIDNLVYTGNQFYIIPKPDGGTHPLASGADMRPIYYSATGTSWAATTSPAEVVYPDKAHHTNLTCNTTTCVLLDTILDDTTKRPTDSRYLVSTDNLNWTVVADTFAGDNVTTALATAYTDTWIAVGGTSTGDAASSTSTDATTWSTPHTWSTGSTQNAYPTTAITIGTTFVAQPLADTTLGTNTTSTDSIWTTTNGTTWTEHTITGTTHIWTSLTSSTDGETLILTSHGSTNTFYTSSNATGWASRTVTNAGTWTTPITLGTSWLLHDNSTGRGYLLPTDPAQTGLPTRILVHAQVRVRANIQAGTAGVTTLGKNAAYTWNVATNQWTISAVYN